MMRSFITLLFLFLVTAVCGQDDDEFEPDSLLTVKLDYEILDSNAIWATNPLTTIYFPNLVSYYSHDGIRLAYCHADTNKWISILLPFSERTNDFDVVNLDNEGQPEVIVRGKILRYGSGGGTGLEGILIISTDSVPTQLAKIYSGCWEESFGDKNNNGEGRYLSQYSRQITIHKSTIKISKLDKSKYPADIECNLTEIPSGSYIMDRGRIIKIK